MNLLHAGNNKHDLTKQTVLQLLNEFHPEDRIMLMGFNSTSWTISQMTHDLEVVRRNLLEHQVVGGKTAIFDALVTALENLEDYSGRRIIVLCSDGEENSSRITLNDLIRALESSDVTIFAIGANFNNRPLKGREVLERITEATGGYTFFSSNMKDLNSLLDQVRNAMTTQYALGYYPPDPTLHGWRRVEIQCKVPRVRLRYRKSYLF